MSTSNNDIINKSSSTNIVDDISNDIEKLTTADESDATSTRSDEMSDKKCTSCENNKLEHTKTDDTSSINDNIDQDIVQENNTDSKFGLEASDMEICANCGKEDAKNICNKCKSVKYCKQPVRKDIDQNTRRSVKNMSDVLLNCTMKR